MEHRRVDRDADRLLSTTFRRVPDCRNSIGLARRAERSIVVGVLAIRVVFVVQLLLALREGVPRATAPSVLLILVALMIGESALFSVHLWRTGAISTRSAAVDVAFAAAMVAAEPLYSSVDDRVGTWVAWGYGAATVASLSAGAGLQRAVHLAAAAATLWGAYLAVSLPGSSRTGLRVTVLINSVAIVGFAGGAWAVARFIRELAFIAEQAQAQAVATARQAELDRHRLLLHDQATVLARLSDPQLDRTTEVALRKQAARGASQIRTFLTTEPAEPPAATVDLALRGLITAAAAEFSDVPLTLNLELLADLTVDRSSGHTLSAAIRTLLHNIRAHAHASSVVLHGDHQKGQWEITIHDNGIGFVPADTPMGYGLRVQAGEALRAIGCQLSVDSAPGEGTTVTISGHATESGQ